MAGKAFAPLLSSRGGIDIDAECRRLIHIHIAYCRENPEPSEHVPFWVNAPKSFTRFLTSITTMCIHWFAVTN